MSSNNALNTFFGKSVKTDFLSMKVLPLIPRNFTIDFYDMNGDSYNFLRNYIIAFRTNEQNTHDGIINCEIDFLKTHDLLPYKLFQKMKSGEILFDKIEVSALNMENGYEELVYCDVILTNIHQIKIPDFNIEFNYGKSIDSYDILTLKFKSQYQIKINKKAG